MTKRHHLNQLPPEKLKEATIKEEWILKDYQKFRTYGAQYIGAAALAFLYQKGRLHDNEFEFLFYRKNIYHAEDYMTP
ncbi:hypothetical protein OAE76_00815, partial [bacterium]|nr:hypothetical protein [bacterium]